MPRSTSWLLTVLAASLAASVVSADDPKEPAGKNPGGEVAPVAPLPPLAPLTPAEEAALDGIIERLKSPDPGTSQRALKDLEPWGRRAKRALPALLARLGDERYAVRELAAKIAGSVGSPAIPALLDLVRKGEKPAAEAAGSAIGRMGPEAAPAVPELTRLLDDPSVLVSLAALEALSGLGPVAAPAVPALLRLSANGNEGLASLALDALTEIAPADPDVLARFEAALRYGRCSPGMSALNGLLRAGRPGWAVLSAAVLSEGFASVRVARSEFGPRRGESDLQFVGVCDALIADGRPMLAEIGRRSIGEIHDADAECTSVAVRRLLAATTTADRLPWLRLLFHVRPGPLFTQAIRPAVPRLREIAASSDEEAKSAAEWLLSRLDEDGGPPTAPKPGDR